MKSIVWIALAGTVLMIAGHVVLFWWFVVRRGRNQPAERATPAPQGREEPGDGADGNGD